MIDTLEANREKAARFDINQIIFENLFEEFFTQERIRNNLSCIKLRENSYGLMTLHRPSNVDYADVLGRFARLLVEEIANELPVIWPLHPRTKKQLQAFGLWDDLIHSANVMLTQPFGYLEMLRLNMDTKIMFTDSRGLQKSSLC